MAENDIIDILAEITPEGDIYDNFENFTGDITMRNLQQNLIMMGFDLIMINKIITHFHINNENEALYYLLKDGN